MNKQYKRKGRPAPVGTAPLQQKGGPPSAIFTPETIPVIAFTGAKGIGKSWAANYMSEEIAKRGWCIGGVLAMADPLKSIAVTIFGPSIIKALTGESKERESPLPFAFGDITSVRKFLQVLGTEMFRSRDPDIWVKVMQMRIAMACFEVAQKAPGQALALFIPDVRFDNELEAIGTRPNSTVVRMVWGEQHPRYAAEIAKMRADTHASEAGISDTVYAKCHVETYTRNVDDTKELRDFCDNLLDKLGLRWGVQTTEPYEMDKLAQKAAEREAAKSEAPQLKLAEAD